MTMGDQRRETDDVDLFGVRLKVDNPRLAALLNSGVTEDAQVVGRRAREVVAPEAPPAAAEPRPGAPEAAGGEGPESAPPV